MEQKVEHQATGTPRDKGEIMRELDKIADSAKTLEKHLDNLAVAIVPVMSPEKPSPAVSENTAKSYGCDLATNLQDIRFKISIAAERIYSLTQRIEL